MTLVVRVEDAAGVDAAWRALLRRAGSPTVFQHPAWHAAWWDVFGDGAPALYVARDGQEEIRGIAPMLRRPDGALTFSGDPEVYDYMDIVAARGDEPAVLGAFLAHWQGEGATRIHLWGLREGSPTLRVLCGAESAPAAYCEEEAVAPRIPLSGGWDDYMGRLSKKDRHELRRKLRRLESSGFQVELRVLTEPAAVEAALPEFFRLHTISRQDKAEFMTAQMEGFFRRVAVDLAVDGLTRLFMVHFGQRPVASLLAFEGEDLAVWNSGFDPEYANLSIGLLSKAMAIRWAQERGLPRVDFLRGREPYKYDLGGQDLVIYRCRVEG